MSTLVVESVTDEVEVVRLPARTRDDRAESSPPGVLSQHRMLTGPKLGWRPKEVDLPRAPLDHGARHIEHPALIVA
ncbi:hypothetical protein ACWD4P_32015 [Kitasatospora sp. NPDC002543]